MGSWTISSSLKKTYQQSLIVSINLRRFCQDSFLVWFVGVSGYSNQLVQCLLIVASQRLKLLQLVSLINQLHIVKFFTDFWKIVFLRDVVIVYVLIVILKVVAVSNGWFVDAPKIAHLKIYLIVSYYILISGTSIQYRI